MSKFKQNQFQLQIWNLNKVLKKKEKLLQTFLFKETLLKTEISNIKFRLSLLNSKIKEDKINFKNQYLVALKKHFEGN